MSTTEHRLNARRCGIHGDNTSSGRCASCDREVARLTSCEDCIVTGCRLEYGHEGQHDFTIPGIAGHAPEESAPPAGWDVAEPGPEQVPPPPFRYVSVRQQAAEEAERAGRTPCREVAHGPECPGDCDPKVGDRVICTDDSASFNRLRRGDTYTVEANFDGSPTVMVNGCSHSIERFRTVREVRP